MNNKSKLSDDLKVACAIYHFNIKNEPVWLSKLEKYLEKCLDRFQVFNHFLTLEDWGIARYEYGKTGKGRAGALFYINDDHVDRIKECYDKYWI